FDEFHRYQQPFDWGEQGLGLGLSICQRISRLLDHRLNARSRVGSGSMFSILLPRVDAPDLPTSAVALPVASPSTRTDSLAGMRVLCVDNDQEILDGMRALLGRWQVEVITASTVDQALEKVAERPDVMLVDYHLHDRLDGLDTLVAMRDKAGRAIPGALLTADGRDELKRMARERGYRLLTKPIKPASLRAFLAAFHDTRGDM
ncbi:MAG TPA: hybrid sensor histidine kinase/response regulator, partial [Stenotrophomonas sp.]|nr:hybrid sensor histidine kinase/response regulator [Stenotrophomonas sp.]